MKVRQAKAGKSAALRSRYAFIREDLTVCEILFVPQKGLTLGLGQRAKEAQRRVARRLPRARPTTYTASNGRIAATFSVEFKQDLRSVLAAIDAELDRLQRERLYPSMVERLLKISGRERIRWTKDGRLRSSGSGSFLNGSHAISFPLYLPTTVIKLVNDPARIQSWRDQDAAAQRQRRG